MTDLIDIYLVMILNDHVDISSLSPNILPKVPGAFIIF